MAQARRPRAAPLDLGILTISLAILLVELLLTRIYSVVMFHHFSFLAVSLAMTGIGFGALLVNLTPRRFRADNIRRVAPLLAAAFALSLLVAAWVAFHMPIRLQATAENLQRVIVVLLLSLVPLTAGGLVVAHILAFNAERANRLYFFDLLGAGLACLLFVPLTNLCGAPTALLLGAAVAMTAGAVLADRARARAVCWLAVVTLLAASAANLELGFFDVRFAKGGAARPTLVTRWNSFSRVEVRGEPADVERLRPPVSWGFSPRLRTQVRELHLLYDADAMTQIVGFDGDLARVEYLLWDVTSAAYRVRRNARVLVIGSGGGRDVLCALASGAESVVGVEINGVTVDLMRERFRDYTGSLYVDYPGVTIVNEDGRSFVRRTSERFDLIQASLVDTWAASSAGAYALAENSLYTVEAFLDYFAKLDADGIVSLSRWYASPPVEVMRVVTLAREALDRLGVAEPARHVAIVRTDSRLTRRPSLATVLVKRSPFTVQEIGALAQWAGQALFDLAYLPPVGARPGSEAVFETLLGSRRAAEDFVETAAYDLSPTTDDRPFFFNRVPIAAWMAHRLGLDAPAYGRGELALGSQTLLTALAVTAVFSLLLIAIPLLADRIRMRRETSSVSLGRRLSWVGYFACLGLGYIVVEIVLIQRFNLYLGHPAYALTVVLFTMLVASAIGALVAGRWRRPRALVPILATVCIAMGAVQLALTPIIGTTLGWPAAARVATAVAALTPIAFVMGMPFPTGLRHAGREASSLVSWGWAVNGGTSVFGSVLAVVVSMELGFSFSLLLATIAYVGALLLALGLVKREPSTRATKI